MHPTTLAPKRATTSRVGRPERRFDRETESEDMIAAVKRGDEAAARELYHRHAERVRHAILRTGGESELDDLCQEVWLRAFRHLSDFRSEADFGTWIFAIARNVAIGWLRGRGRYTALTELITEVAIPGSHPRQVHARIDLQRALGELPSGMREVFLLRAQGFTHQEVGVAIGVSEGTSKSQFFRARARLRSQLTEGAPSFD